LFYEKWGMGMGGKGMGGKGMGGKGMGEREWGMGGGGREWGWEREQVERNGKGREQEIYNKHVDDIEHFMARNRSRRMVNGSVIGVNTRAIRGII
jgi:hypothetical protein